MKKIITVVGARPQFIKAAAVSRIIRTRFADRVEEVLIHTGQHYDDNMSKIFFDELDIPHPKYNLEISGGQHGAMTGRMLEAIEKVLLQEQPDWLLIYGDTNSTLAGALAAAKLHIPVAHVEAGLRSFNMHMPEEVNRILADRVSSLLFCPTQTAVDNLKAEGVLTGVHNVGDVMYEAALYYGKLARENSDILAQLSLGEKQFVLATCHRAENTDDPQRLTQICLGLASIAKLLPVVLPLHPRTRNIIDQLKLGTVLEQVQIVEPLSYIEMVALQQDARAILTDSGGVQKEAFFFDTPCITFRDETEWVETLVDGWNQLVGADAKAMRKAFEQTKQLRQPRRDVFGRGQTASAVLETILSSPTS
ncbi:MAG: UDP-N-acetylglucosamine 2-epimerase (non-hydrolyzing) [Proteobacteria bacterium]|nr:UDP-N-acetylglucosamine 2-epimerase (non-hydrolyzing) [Pseudomonadota bacterium]HQR03311.1 UDP-N-acetylglucosamine 2-epimerase (non-hydrolyzing) [Rhodocyclaceae bacterium]